MKHVATSVIPLKLKLSEAITDNNNSLSKQLTKNLNSENTLSMEQKNIRSDTNDMNEIFSKFHINYKVVVEPIKDKDVPKTKYNKTLNKFIPFLQFKKLSIMEPNVFDYRKEVENLILQNLTEIRRWYQYSNRLALESEEARLKREQEIYSPH